MPRLFELGPSPDLGAVTQSKTAAARGGSPSASAAASDKARPPRPLDALTQQPSSGIHALAEQGTATQGGPLPYLDKIQRAFGRHRIGEVVAHTDSTAAQAARGMGARAFTFQNHVAFGGAPDLHTAAHEAAHVVQQQAGVHLAGGVGAENDVYEQHADDVADLVVMGMSAEPLLDHYVSHGAQGGRDSSAVQRKVFIKNTQQPLDPTTGLTNYRRKTKTRRGQSIRQLIQDDESYYFDSKTEMSDFAAGSAPNIGYLEREQQWIRLPEQLTVIGEDHGETTTAHLAAATECTRYKYEGFTAQPEGHVNDNLRAARQQRSDQVAADSGMSTMPTVDNEGESFFPKLLRMLDEVNIGPNRLTLNDFGRRAFRWSILYAQRAQRTPINYFYRRNQGILDQAAGELAPNSGIANLIFNANDSNRRIARQFYQVIANTCRQKIAEERASLGNTATNFSQHWDGTASRRYGAGKEMANEADDARDLSMYHHILQAQQAGFLLYGLGNNHRLRMSALLTHDGIEHKTMAAFLADQRRRYPQV